VLFEAMATLADLDGLCLKDSTVGRSHRFLAGRRCLGQEGKKFYRGKKEVNHALRVLKFGYSDAVFLYSTMEFNTFCAFALAPGLRFPLHAKHKVLPQFDRTARNCVTEASVSLNFLKASLSVLPHLFRRNFVASLRCAPERFFVYSLKQWRSMRTQKALVSRFRPQLGRTASCKIDCADNLRRTKRGFSLTTRATAIHCSQLF
jgi:hypothetical protein